MADALSLVSDLDLFKDLFGSFELFVPENELTVAAEISPEIEELLNISAHHVHDWTS